MTLWPDLNARRARLRPKPEEQPVMNHTGEEGGVDIIALYEVAQGAKERKFRSI